MTVWPSCSLARGFWVQKESSSNSSSSSSSALIDDLDLSSKKRTGFVFELGIICQFKMIAQVLKSRAAGPAIGMGRRVPSIYPRLLAWITMGSFLARNPSQKLLTVRGLEL
jgi:hypothetical protein